MIVTRCEEVDNSATLQNQSSDVEVEQTNIPEQINGDSGNEEMKEDGLR